MTAPDMATEALALIERLSAERDGLKSELAHVHTLNADLRLRNADLEGYANIVASRARAEENERCAKICMEQWLPCTAEMIRRSLPSCTCLGA